MKAYITQIASFLPNGAVANDEVEKVLGQVGNHASRTRRRVLEANGIKARHYAIDPGTGLQTHSNAQLSAEAVRQVEKQTGLSLLPDLGLLACGTASADQQIPSHGSMVHGELKAGPCEVVSMSGACCTGAAALKYAMLAVSSGDQKRAVVTASELISPLMRARHFEPEIAERVAALEKNPTLAFEHDFLRWMLSDGAAAILLEAEPVQRGTMAPMRIEWVESLSFAGETDPCMYHLAQKRDGKLISWKEVEDPREWLRGGFFNMGQDARQLAEHIGPLMQKGLAAVLKKHPIKSEDLAWLISHHSSEFFRSEVLERLVEAGLPLPEEKVFTTLSEQGNTGSASVFLSLEALSKQGRLKSGQKVLLFVPESARFSVAFVLLTVV